MIDFLIVLFQLFLVVLGFKLCLLIYETLTYLIALIQKKKEQLGK